VIRAFGVAPNVLSARTAKWIQREKRKLCAIWPRRCRFKPFRHRFQTIRSHETRSRSTEVRRGRKKGSVRELYAGRNCAITRPFRPIQSSGMFLVAPHENSAMVADRQVVRFIARCMAIISRRYAVPRMLRRLPLRGHLHVTVLKHLCYICLTSTMRWIQCTHSVRFPRHSCSAWPLKDLNSPGYVDALRCEADEKVKRGRDTLPIQRLGGIFGRCCLTISSFSVQGEDPCMWVFIAPYGALCSQHLLRIQSHEACKTP
jgi:hypothetical protein